MTKLPEIFCKPLDIDGIKQYAIYWQYTNPLSIYAVDSSDIIYLLKIEAKKFHKKYRTHIKTVDRRNMIVFKTEEEAQVFIDDFLMPRVIAYNLIFKEKNNF